MDARICRNGAAFASLALMVLSLASLPCWAQQQQDSDPVAEAARKAREQKKKSASQPKKVYTDEDVNHLTSADVPASSDKDASGTAKEGAAKDSESQGEAKGKDAEAKTPEPKESPEAKWRKQFKEAYANLDRAQRELDVLQREDNKAQVQYYSDPQKALTEQYTRKDINDKDAKIAAKKQEIEQLKQRISGMEDELRKSGGDPGWANP
jgi:hypothetical protein